MKRELKVLSELIFLSLPPLRINEKRIESRIELDNLTSGTVSVSMKRELKVIFWCLMLIYQRWRINEKRIESLGA